MSDEHGRAQTDGASMVESLEGARSVHRRTAASPQQVWDVIADGWTYGSWVVGASRVRSVDPSWPAPGATLHHSVGSWPVVINDSTSVLVAEPGRRLVLAARVRPIGLHAVEIAVRDQDGGSMVSMREEGSHGPVRLLPHPARQAALVVRNREALHRLCLLAERETDPGEA